MEGVSFSSILVKLAMIAMISGNRLWNRDQRVACRNKGEIPNFKMAVVA
jgi:hypothetical protein